MKKSLGFVILIAVCCAGCAPALKDLKPALSAADSGGIWFASAGSLVRSPDGSQPAFRAFLPFYPYCNTVYPERERISAPVRIHIGELDDWTPAGPCVRLAETLKTSGQDAKITVYAGAHHSFDSIRDSFLRLPNVDSGADCTLQVASILGPIPSASEMAQCLRKGATVAPNPQATEQARRNVRAQLAELLK